MTAKTQSNLSRRDFLKFSAIGAVIAAGGYSLVEYAPWLDYNDQAEKTWRSDESMTNFTSPMHKLVHYANLAANGHNTQPWKFALFEDAIEIHPDTTRRLAVVDPDQRELWISLGCALENLLVAAHAGGFNTDVIYPDSTDFIRIQLSPGSPQSGPLFEALTLRQNTRTIYDGRLIPVADFDQIQTLSLEPGVNLRFITTPTEMETVLEYVNQGNLSQYADPAFLEELIYWLRFNKKEALASMDGLYSACTGNPQVPRWVGKMFVSGMKPQQQADADAKKLRSSPAAVVIASETDLKTSWVRTGQVYERLALDLTSLNIKSALLNQPIEVTSLRSQFQAATGLGNALPQLLVRFGYAQPTPRSLRRPLESVLL